MDDVLTPEEKTVIRQTVSFPTHVLLAKGDAIEVAISRSFRPDGLPWFLSYVPQVDRMRLMRDVERGEGCADFFSSAPTDPLSCSRPQARGDEGIGRQPVRSGSR